MFELDNQDIIKRTISSHVSEVEPMYWILEDALYKGDISRAKALFHLLLYTAKFRPDLIAKGLKPKHRERMKEICDQMHGQPTAKEIKPITVKFATAPKELPFSKECELQIFLYNHAELLCDAFNDKVMIIGTEVETDCGYKCDIIAESPKMFYPIELKIGQSNHSVVSQIDKYMYYFYRTLRYNHYRDLQGVVISNGFDAWSINELRRKGFWIFDVFPNGDAIKLVKID